MLKDETKLRKSGKIVEISLIILLITVTSSAKVSYVDPFIGTGGHGHTFPGATQPFGMVQLSPDTDTEGWDWCSGYHYSDSSIIGFSHTHLSGTGIGDYGDILFMPTTGEIQLKPGSKENPENGYRSAFDHKNESAHPGYYSVELKDYNIGVKLTTSKRAGFHQYKFPKSKKSNIILDLFHGIQDKPIESHINVVNEREIEGYRHSRGWAEHTFYFVAKISIEPENISVVKNNKILKDKSKISGKNTKAFLQFATEKDQKVKVKVGISPVSIEGARENLDKEIPGWNFKKIKTEAEERWAKTLSKIDYQSGINQSKEKFYTALYHSMISPNLFEDVDNNYLGHDEKIHKAKDFKYYTVFSLWDTFRAKHPLLNLISPGREEGMIKTMLKQYEQGGYLPVWELAGEETNTMIGYHSIPLIADAYLKGNRNFDVDKAYNAMKKSAMRDKFGLESYKKFGYIPSHKDIESVSKTLEYAYDDWCIAKMANILGKKDDYKKFIKRGQYYKNVFDKQTKFMRGKNRGKWTENFDPKSVTGEFTEANSWQYSFFAPQDVKGLMELYGGREKFEKKIDSLFNVSSEVTGNIQRDITGLIGQYAHGNEPSHHMAYLYSFVNKEYKTQEIVRKIMDEQYTTKVDGLAGNEDCGQMSSWYVFSALGFYPVTPGKNYYVLGSPVVKHARINLENGKTVKISATNNSSKNKYIKEIYVNGQPYKKPYITHNKLTNGADIKFIMTDKPVNTWFEKNELVNKSQINEKLTPTPYFDYETTVFKDEQKIALDCIDPDANIYYTLDETTPDRDSRKYTEPFTIRTDRKVKARAFSEDNFPSKTVSVYFQEVNFKAEIELNTDYSPQYPADGKNTLINNVLGGSHYNAGWQGYYGNNVNAVVDLKKKRDINKISIRFLQDIGSWIFMPTKVKFLISDNKENFNKIGVVKNTIPAKKKGTIIDTFSVDINKKARYIKVIGYNRKECPNWHVGSGEKAWIFTDEIIVE